MRSNKSNGDINSVSPGIGLSGGGVSGAVTIAANMLYLQRISHNASSAPTSNNDSIDSASIGRTFKVGDFWVDTSLDMAYVCVDATVTAAIWHKIDIVDHGNLTGLTDDDHTQYVKKTGRATGQTIQGGIAAGENLSLGSTEHATKGKIYIGSDSAYDETNKNLGIGTTTPLAAATLNIYNSASGGKIRIQNSSTGQGANDGFSFELGGTEAYLWNFENSVIYIGTNNVVRMKILNNAVIERYNNGGNQKVSQKINTVTTTTDTPTDLSTIAIAEGETWYIEAAIVARKSDGSEHAIYHLQGCFYRNTSGNVTQQGSTIVSAIESDASWDADLVADTVSQTVDLRVTGAAATTILWKADIKYMKHSG